MIPIYSIPNDPGLVETPLSWASSGDYHTWSSIAMSICNLVACSLSHKKLLWPVVEPIMCCTSTLLPKVGLKLRYSFGSSLLPAAKGHLVKSFENTNLYTVNSCSTVGGSAEGYAARGSITWGTSLGFIRPVNQSSGDGIIESVLYIWLRAMDIHIHLCRQIMFHDMNPPTYALRLERRTFQLRCCITILVSTL